MTFIQGGVCSYVEGWSNGTFVTEKLRIQGETILKLDLEMYNVGHSVMMTYDGKLMSCGGYYNKNCYELKEGMWVRHSTLNKLRPNAVGIAMPNGIYMFEGLKNPYSSEFLPIGRNVWESGPKIPALCSKFSILKPIRFLRHIIRDFIQRWKAEAWYSTGHKLSEHEFIIIKVDQVFKFDTIKNEWTVLHDLKIPRECYSSFIFKGKLFITGGCGMYGSLRSKVLANTEVVDLSTMKSTMIGNLNTARIYHGMSIMKINHELKLVVFGGQTTFDHSHMLDSIEVWNEHTKSWDKTEIKLPRKNSRFATTPIF